MSITQQEPLNVPLEDQCYLGGQCHVDEWTYEMQSANPRMFGVCQNCGQWIIVILPRQAQGIGFSDTLEEQIRIAAQFGLAQRGIAQRIFPNTPQNRIYLTDHIASEIRRRLGEKIKELTEETKQLREELRQMRKPAYHHLDEEYAELRECMDELWMRKRALYDLEAMLKGDLRELFQKYRNDEGSSQLQTNWPVLCDGRPFACVYGLIHSGEPKRIRYVGQSVNYPLRYATHCSTNVSGIASVIKWVKTLPSPPTMVLIEKCHPVELLTRETHWIRHFQEQGMADLNEPPRQKAGPKGMPKYLF